MRLISFIALLLLSSTVAGRSHGHSSRGGSSQYPHSTGYSGYGSGGAKTSHTYPHSTGLSGNSNSGNVRQTYHQQQYNVQHNYYYSPPQQINYGSVPHPVYPGHPPVYVYEYRDSGSRFDSLLTGLALYNLGRNSHSHHYESERQYRGSPGEICKLGISKRNGEYEETRIDCMLMSSFIWDDTTHATRDQQHVIKSTTEVKVTETLNGSTSRNSSVTTVVKSETVEDALKVKGPSVEVKPGMTCYMIRIYRDISTTRKPVDCGLLQEYARRSLQRNGSHFSTIPFITISFSFLILWLINPR